MKNPRWNYTDKLALVAYQAHADCNHKYAGDLPYSFHLRMGAAVADQFGHLLSSKMDHYVPELDVNASEYDLAVLAVYFHDAIEDARMTYNDVRKLIGERAADAVYAVTNEKGKNRAERANDKYYQGIRETPLATFVKLCDRIANVKYGLMVGSHMAEMYGKENPDFVKKLGYNEEHPLAEMFEHLNSLLK